SASTQATTRADTPAIIVIGWRRAKTIGFKPEPIAPIFLPARPAPGRRGPNTAEPGQEQGAFHSPRLRIRALEVESHQGVAARGFPEWPGEGIPIRCRPIGACRPGGIVARPVGLFNERASRQIEFRQE